jgi:hypothetical protein
MPSRWIPRELHEDARYFARAMAKAKPFEQSRRERKNVGMCFAHTRRFFKLDRPRLRGLSRLKNKMLLSTTA